MKPAFTIDQLKQLKVIMLAMLTEAKRANWQELSRLDSERRVLINYQATATDRPREELNQTPVKHQKPMNVLQKSSSQAAAGSSTPGVRSAIAPSANATAPRPDPEYLALCTELTAIDKEISDTVQRARNALLEQTRGLKAQVSAKKEYEQANIMKVTSYS